MNIESSTKYLQPTVLIFELCRVFKIGEQGASLNEFDNLAHIYASMICSQFYVITNAHMHVWHWKGKTNK